MTVGRPGKGGRKRRPLLNTVEGVINELESRYGEGRELRKHRHILRYFEIDPEGDGALMARLSGNDITCGETVATQLDVQHEMAERLALRPRWVIVELNADRNIAYEQRLGFALVRDLVALHDVRWLAWREIDRIARDQMTNMAFCNWMRQSELRLYLATEPEPLVDWNSARLNHSVRRLLAEWEADKIVERTATGRRRRYLEAGRGWPGYIPFGFCRGAGNFLVVDDEQWDVVERIYERYLSQHPDGRPLSMRDVVNGIRAEGIDITYYVVQRVLTSRVYVTGQLQVNCEGRTYDVRPIQLRRPISEEDFARAQAQRAARGGKNTVTPYGCFLLNHILLVHASCDGVRVNGNQVRLSAYIRREGTPRAACCYHHMPANPSCSLVSVPVVALEQAAINALYRLAGDEQLRAQWIANGRGDGQTSGAEPTDDEIAMLEARLAHQRHRHADLLARFVADDATHGDTVAQYATLANALEIDVRRLEQRLDRTRRERRGRVEPLTAGSLKQRLREQLPLDPPLGDPAALRRRVEILRACVSKVVVYDDRDSGLTIELFGPLVPPTAPLVTGLPGDTIASQKVIGKTLLADQFVPAWRSCPLPLPATARERPTVESLIADIRSVHAASPPEVMFAFRHATCAWTDRRESLDLASVYVLRGVRRRHGLTPDDLVREALSPRDIVEGRRVRCLNASEWLAAFHIAFERGLGPSRLWQREWEGSCWPSLRALRLLGKRSGMPPSRILELAYASWLGEAVAWPELIDAPGVRRRAGPARTTGGTRAGRTSR